MQCPEFEAALQDAADRRELIFGDSDGDAPHDRPESQSESRPGDQPDQWPALRRHADACPRCRSMWRQFHFVDDALRSWGRQSFEVNLADAVMARWRHERSEHGQPDESHAAAVMAGPPPVARPGRSGQRLRAAVYGAAIASLLAVLIGPPWWLDPAETTHHPNPPVHRGQPSDQHMAPGRTDAPVPPITEDTAPVAMTRRDPEPVPWGSLVENAGTAYRIVADDTAETWSSVKQLVSAWTPTDRTPTDRTDMPESITDGNTDGNTDEPSGTDTGEVRPWLDELRRDWQPVGRDMTRPLEFLRQALPDPSATL